MAPGIRFHNHILILLTQCISPRHLGKRLLDRAKLGGNGLVADLLTVITPRREAGRLEPSSLDETLWLILQILDAVEDSTRRRFIKNWMDRSKELINDWREWSECWAGKLSQNSTKDRSRSLNWSRGYFGTKQSPRNAALALWADQTYFGKWHK